MSNYGSEHIIFCNNGPIESDDTCAEPLKKRVILDHPLTSCSSEQIVGKLSARNERTVGSELVSPLSQQIKAVFHLAGPPKEAVDVPSLQILLVRTRRIQLLCIGNEEILVQLNGMLQEGEAGPLFEQIKRLGPCILLLLAAHGQSIQHHWFCSSVDCLPTSAAARRA